MVQKRWIALALFLLTLVCFGHVCLCEFVQWDDQAFVTDNPHVLGGLTLANIRWAFGENYGGWTPVMWLSYQLDATLFGPDGAWGFHLTNLLIHAVSVVVFFLLLDRLTGELWPSAVCAALFAVHPLRVESVAWVAERRDVLSIFLLMVTLAAYRYYTEFPGWGRYLLVVLSFGVGLAAKPMLVTLPFALLLLDYWPLYRLRLGQAAPAAAQAKPAASWLLVILEKIPMLAMALSASLLTYGHVKHVGGMTPEIRWQDRLAVSLAAYLGYLEKTFWPANLAALYPYRVPPWWVAMFAAAILLAVTAAFVVLRRRRPMLLVGWLWFAGTLFPVSGVVQIGMHSLADRYSYMPHLGLLIAVVWGVSGLTAWQQANGTMRRALVGLVLFALGILTWLQVWYWQNTFILFQHTVNVTENNVEFHVALNRMLEERNHFKEAEKHLERALAISPKNRRVIRAHGAMLLRQEKYQAAVEQLEASLLLGYDNAETNYALGVALDKLGRKEDAVRHLQKSIVHWETPPPVDFIGSSTPSLDRKVRPHLWLSEMALREGNPVQSLAHLERALAIKPGLTEGHQLKGIALGRLDRWAEAEVALQNALHLNASNDTAHGYLAFAYARQGKAEQAAREYADLLRRFPDWPQASSDLALKRITTANFLDLRMAEEVAQQICEATHYQNPRWLDTLAAVQAAKGDFAQARQTVDKALSMKPDSVLAQQLQERRALYQANRALPKE